MCCVNQPNLSTEADTAIRMGIRKGRSESIVESNKTSPDVQRWERGRRSNRTAWVLPGEMKMGFYSIKQGMEDSSAQALNTIVKQSFSKQSPLNISKQYPLWSRRL